MSSHVLFAFDEESIPWRDNLKLTLVQAVKHSANPVLKAGPAGSADFGHALLYGTVIHHNGKFRMWYLGMIERELNDSQQAPGWWRPMCYAESEDGIHWHRPELGLVESNGSTKNNICLIESEPHSLSRVNDFLTVLYEPDDPDPSRQYKAAFIAHVPMEDVRGGSSNVGPAEERWGAFICATSADGLRWKVVGDRPANAGGERFEVTGLYRFDGMYYAPGQLLSPWAWLPDGRDAGRVMMIYRSGDFAHWSRAKALAFLRDGQRAAEPTPGQQVHMGAGLWNRENVMIGLYGMWQTRPDQHPHDAFGARIDLGLIVSNNGIHFREPVPGFKVIARGDESQWDQIALLQSHGFVNHDGLTYIWYSHWDSENQYRGQHIGLATLRQDGFGYLSHQYAEAPGGCITRTLPASPGGYRFRINVDGVSAKSPLKVELVDKTGASLPDYSGKNAAIVATHGVDVEIIWPVGQSSRVTTKEPVAMQLTLPDADDMRVYALYADT